MPFCAYWILVPLVNRLKEHTCPQVHLAGRVNLYQSMVGLGRLRAWLVGCISPNQTRGVHRCRVCFARLPPEPVPRGARFLSKPGSRDTPKSSFSPGPGSARAGDGRAGVRELPSFSRQCLGLPPLSRQARVGIYIPTASSFPPRSPFSDEGRVPVLSPFPSSTLFVESHPPLSRRTLSLFLTGRVPRPQVARSGHPPSYEARSPLPLSI
jgi:hypothetical protein